MAGTPTLFVRATKSQTADPNRALRVQRADAYPEQIWFFLACFIGLVTLCHVGVLVVFWRRKRHASRAVPEVGEKAGGHGEPAKSHANERISLRRIPLAVVNWFRILVYRRTVRIGGGHVVNGAEIAVTAGYIIALFTWEFINSMNVTTKVKLDVAYWANRAGNIVATQLPLIVALSGKNNIISLLTGISYEKLNVLHRAAARVCLILVWVHAGGRVHQGLKGSTGIFNPWLRTGIATATAYTILVIISVKPLRARFYEFFFFSHFVLVLLILIGAYFHIRLGFGFGPYLIPSFVLWALDRVLRVLRVLWLNRTTSTARADVLSPTMVRLALTRHMTWRAGQNAYITLPGVSRIPFEAHPFTIASVPHAEGEGKEEGNELVFFVRVKEGFTKRLLEAAGRSDGGSGVPLSVYVDGPYGSPPDLNAFENVVLIAGGSGISYTLPLLQDIVCHARQGTTACRSVFFLWAVPHRGHLSWVSHALEHALETAPSFLRVQLRVHVTRGAYSEGSSDTNSSEGPSDDKEHTGPDASTSPSDDKGRTDPDPDAATEKLVRDARVVVGVGRPDVRVLIQEELASATGPASVDVAGPGELAADVRKVLRSGHAGPQAILKGSVDVTLHVETYGIA